MERYNIVNGRMKKDKEGKYVEYEEAQKVIHDIRLLVDVATSLLKGKRNLYKEETKWLSIK